MSALEKYSSYKDSGVEWIGEIPQHWEIRKLKYMTTNLNNRRIPIESSIRGNMEKRDYDYYGATGVIDRVEDYIFDEPTIVIAEDGANLLYRNIKLIYLPSGKYWVNNHAHILKANKDYDKNFIAYLLENHNYTTLISGSAQPKLTKENLMNIDFFVASKQEQTKIANFLDKKTAQIDEAIKQKDELIGLLKEKRQVLIHKAVTQGLDSTVKMKDSGVEWIGEIPAHWTLLPGFKVYKENKIKNIGMIEERVLSLSYGNIIIKPKEKLVGLVPESFETYQIVNPGDIIIRCMDLQNDKTSLRTGIAKDRGIITSAYLNLNVFNNVISEYLHHYLHMLDTTKVLYKFGTGLRQNLSYFDFKRLPVIFPDLKEQENILKYIDTNTTKIDSIIDLQKKYITQLKEYKATLIDSCVTGKVRVR